MSKKSATKKKIREQEQEINESVLVQEQATIETVHDVTTFEEIAPTKLEEQIDGHRADLDAARQAARESVRDLKTKSAKIRALAAQGYKVAEIAKILGIIYQHARNVLITPLKTNVKKAIQAIQEETTDNKQGG